MEPRGSESEGSNSSSNQRMDVKMFIKYALTLPVPLRSPPHVYVMYFLYCETYRAAEMDDVLLQAMWRRPRGCLRALMQNARTKAAAGGYRKSVAEVIEEDLLAVLEPAMHKGAAGADGTPGSRRGRNISLGAAFGEFDCQCFFRVPQDSHYCLSVYTGRAAMGLAGKIVEGAQTLKSDFDEA